MNEYTFLGSHSFRSRHVNAKSLREAFTKTRAWYKSLAPDRQKEFGVLRTTYQWGRDGCTALSGWIHSCDKKLKEQVR